MAVQFYSVILFLFSSMITGNYTSTYSSNYKLGKVDYNRSRNIQAAELEKHIGKEVSICSRVFDVNWPNTSGQTATFNLGGEYVNEHTRIAIRFQEGFTTNEDLQQLLADKTICLNGIIIDHFGKPELFIPTEEAQHILDEARQIMPVKQEVELKGQKLKVLNNAYLLEGPKWKAPVVTHLKAGSIIELEKNDKGWTYVRVVEKFGFMIDPADKIQGYLYNDALGLDRKGRLKK